MCDRVWVRQSKAPALWGLYFFKTGRMKGKGPGIYPKQMQVSELESSSLSDLYDVNYLAWTESTVQLLKHGKLSELDIKNL
jgi:hypothetical protein